MSEAIKRYYFKVDKDEMKLRLFEEIKMRMSDDFKPKAEGADDKKEENKFNNNWN